MLGKDYMLAIVIVKCGDNIWNDQSLDLDSDLPSGWRTIRDAAGTYYWHVPTGATQWQHPAYDADDSSIHEDDGQPASNAKSQEGAGSRRGSKAHRLTNEPVASLADRSPWDDDYSGCNLDPDIKSFAVRSLGWQEVAEEELVPGRSGLIVNDAIQKLAHHRPSEGRETTAAGGGAWGEGRDMTLILRRDTLSLVDPVGHAPLHCQPIVDIRVWGVGCNNGRDFAFVSSDKDSSMLKCHVFRCDAPAKAIATALHQMYSKIMSEKALSHPSNPSVARSLTMESISPEDLPLQVDFLDAVRQRVQKFDVQYVGNLPVSRAMGMEVLNRAIESIMSSTETEEWEPVAVHVSDTVLSLWRQEEPEGPFWTRPVRYLTFLGVGHDSRTFAIIADGGTRRFECHVFWCEPDAGLLSESVQAACMVQYQKCLVAQTPPPRLKAWRTSNAPATSKVKRANSMDGTTFLLSGHASCYLGDDNALTTTTTTAGMTSVSKGDPGSRSSRGSRSSSHGAKKGMLAFFETFRNKSSNAMGEGPLRGERVL